MIMTRDCVKIFHLLHPVLLLRLIEPPPPDEIGYLCSGSKELHFEAILDFF
jgi:hypothetical protein